MPLYVQIMLYFLLISALGVVITIFDKRSAKAGGQRIPEATLFLVAALGAALPMYFTMKRIRHKTLHKRFMIGLPLLFVLQTAGAGAIVWFLLH